MTTIRVAKRARYTSISRPTLNDDRLSFRARGVLVWLLDKPDDWKVDSDLIASNGSEGRDAIRNALKELETHGYLKRDKYRDSAGRFVTEVTVYETSVQNGLSVVGVTCGNSTDPQVSPETENPASVDQALYKELRQKTKSGWQQPENDRSRAARERAESEDRVARASRLKYATFGPSTEAPSENPLEHLAAIKRARHEPKKKTA